MKLWDQIQLWWERVDLRDERRTLIREKTCPECHNPTRYEGTVVVISDCPRCRKRALAEVREMILKNCL